MSTPIIADWGNVTLAQYDAIALVRQPNAEDLLNQYWEDRHAHNAFAEAEPTKLTDEGKQWLAKCHEIVAHSDDEPLIISTAREIVRALGTLTVIGAVRMAKEKSN